MRCAFYVSFILLAVCFVSFAATLSAQVTYSPAITGLSDPVSITNAGDGSGRLFITQQSGTIQLWNGSALSTFLDVSSLTDFDNGERGLLSVAFSPNYKTNGTFWIYYTDTNGNITVARYKVSAGDPNVADPTTGQVILSIAHPTFANHNGGQLEFGADGYLYLGTGDGGSGGDPNGNGQNLGVLLAKILRIDPVVSGGPPYYNIPASNPFVGVMGAKPEIWAYGVRNPWRFTFDRTTHDLWIGDVGQNCWEEVDLQAASSTGGQNYGWNIKEGRHCYVPADGCSPPTGACNFGIDAANPPIFEYSHAANPNPNNCNAITGGYVYRGSQIPSLGGAYIYGEYCGGTVWDLTFDSGTSSWISTQLFDTDYFISTFGEDESGEVYFADRAGGTVYKLISASTLPYSDDFNDGVFTWINVTGSWTETGGNLTNVGGKNGQVVAPSGNCSVCTIDTDVQVTRAGATLYVFGWRQDKSNLVQLKMMEAKDKWELDVVSHKRVIAKTTFSSPIATGTSYHVKMSYDGSQVQVFIDGSVSPNLTLSATGLNGFAGFGISKGTALIDDIQIN